LLSRRLADGIEHLATARTMYFQMRMTYGDWKLAHNPKVTGSNPAPATNVLHAASWFIARRLSRFRRQRISKGWGALVFPESILFGKRSVSLWTRAPFRWKIL
jgi:hypothetical protein